MVDIREAGLRSKCGWRTFDPPLDSLRQGANASAIGGVSVGFLTEVSSALCRGLPDIASLVEQFRAVGVSRPVDLTDLDDRVFALGVIDAWAETDELPPEIAELREALRADKVSVLGSSRSQSSGNADGTTRSVCSP
jgi:hypothetical protein